MDISVVVPAYNEARGIGAAIAQIVAAVQEFAREYEIVVVDDGSTDGTAREARKWAELFPRRVLVVEAPSNAGKGAALMLGAMYATGRRIAFLDADLDIHPRQLRGLMDAMDASGAEAVIGSKRHPESEVVFPWFRRVMSTGYFMLVKALFAMPIRDTQTGIKLFRREHLHAVIPRLCVKRFAFDLELLVNICRAGGRIAEAPVTICSQRLAQRIRFRDVKTIFIDTLAVFYRARIRRWYDRPATELSRTIPPNVVVSHGRLADRTAVTAHELSEVA